MVAALRRVVLPLGAAQLMSAPSYGARRDAAAVGSEVIELIFQSSEVQS